MNCKNEFLFMRGICIDAYGLEPFTEITKNNPRADF